MTSRAQGGDEGGGIKEEIEGVGGAGDEEVCGEEGVEGAAFAIVHGDGEASGSFHRGEEQAVVIAVAEDGDMPQIEFLCEVALFDVLTFLSQHVGHGDSSELLTRGAIRVRGDDFEIDEFPQAKQARPYARREFAAIGKRSSVVGDDGADHALALRSSG